MGVIEKIFGKIKKTNKVGKEDTYQTNKWVTFTSNHNTTYLEPNWSYPVFKEEGKWYYFKFGGKIIKYPKHYFEDYVHINDEI